MKNVETIIVESRTVPCDGDGGALGHPKVYLEIPHDESEITCPYCSRRFVLDAAKKTAVGH
ncbi:zinc-finger domain-containing protein [Varunaivibrio sulfuroxidans]|uniref:Putative Zn-finger protein n=1 Tax=Varunaivibrio sulfuroxidans TaxID=1773489 RepID=A0A4R3JEX1_9PROT|nr:zinc-finger domain-containing protein [Varunaivibrio sulfuroxidans]TCS63676.1 putative Zn-finger protein [Varunaivibrio sulfuroxidans]WES30189.1 zinc-finger domain-containing protein [Varunaivibrio sulfuroxidans]